MRILMIGARCGTVLAPGPADYPSQYIDGRDMAHWIVDMVARHEGGTFHATGPSAQFTWGEELKTILDAMHGAHAADGACASRCAATAKADGRDDYRRAEA